MASSKVPLVRSKTSEAVTAATSAESARIWNFILEDEVIGRAGEARGGRKFDSHLADRRR